MLSAVGEVEQAVGAVGRRGVVHERIRDAAYGVRADVGIAEAIQQGALARGEDGRQGERARQSAGDQPIEVGDPGDVGVDLLRTGQPEIGEDEERPGRGQRRWPGCDRFSHPRPSSRAGCADLRPPHPASRAVDVVDDEVAVVIDVEGVDDAVAVEVAAGAVEA